MKNIKPHLPRDLEVPGFIIGRFHIHHMRRIVFYLKMDFESVYVWGSLALLNDIPRISHSMAAEATERPPRSSVRLTDLAMICGLPLETVRRKLKKLEALGKVEQRTDSTWCILDQGIDQTAVEFTYESLNDFMRTSELLGQFMPKRP